MLRETEKFTHNCEKYSLQFRKLILTLSPSALSR